jgi:phage FluMu gp28-like protein
VSVALNDGVLLDYQRKWIADDSPVKVAEKSRRIGFTWAEAADDALYASQINGDDVSYIGYNKDIAVEFIETVAWWAKHYQLAAGAIEDAGEVLEDADKENGILAFKVRFASGHKVIALSSKPRNLRGRQGRVVIDEYAFHPDKKELLKAAMALLMWGGKVRIISTHDGEDNEFNELVNDIRAGRRPFSLHRVTLDDALGDGLYRRICQKLRQPWSLELQEQWRSDLIATYGEGADEELFCIPRSGGGAYIPGALIQARMNKSSKVVRWKQTTAFAEDRKEFREVECRAWLEGHVRHLLEDLDPDLLTVFGEDFGRSGDLTDIWVMQIARNMVRKTPFIVELRNIPFEQQKQVLFYIVDNLPRFYAGKLDARGNGQYLAEVAMQRYGSGRIEQVMISAEWYRDNMPKYKAAYEDAMIEVPQDSDILEDHRAIRVVKGIPRVPEDARTIGQDAGKRHGDSAIAGCMAYAASLTDVIDYQGFTPVARGSQSTSSRDRNSNDDDELVAAGRFNQGAF